MRVATLLGSLLLLTSLLCNASDPTDTSANSWLVVPSGKTGYAFSQFHGDVSKAAKLLRDRTNPQRRAENDYCLMLRTYIVVREDRDSDLTRRDGEVVCQPAWKFQTRSAVGSVEDR